MKRMEVIIHGHEAFTRQWEQATYVMKVQCNRRVDNNCSWNSCFGRTNAICKDEWAKTCMTRDRHMVAFMNDTKAILITSIFKHVFWIKWSKQHLQPLLNYVTRFYNLMIIKWTQKNPTHHRVLKNVMQSRLNLMNVNVEVSVPV